MNRSAAPSRIDDLDLRIVKATQAGLPLWPRQIAA